MSIVEIDEEIKRLTKLRNSKEPPSKAGPNHRDLDLIVNVVSLRFNVTPAMVLSKNRARCVVDARYAFILIAIESCLYSQRQLTYFTNSERTSIGWAYNKARDVYFTDSKFKSLVEDSKNDLSL